ncbi:methionine ABC transporter ATP-binding protein [Kushneria phosphatilytica]|uniref:Cell division ATP-binding protein FtsE n=1 Tax=Kushneria phosphatilytica TaxID=657387 RepID=A0A5C1A2U5_9GAMM|nr:methionine ABC transporter ATP-binding protein [Kushneria phosphatilytica]QEL11265.1 methionine ABC transporter ATP-binding protein [Kushneria phosphatilytica]
MIQLDNVTRIFGQGGSAVKALDDVSLAVPAGSITGVIGTSGAGKSTLIRCVNLLERPTSGHVTVNGVELTGLNDRELRRARHDIGMIFQHFNLLNSRTVRGNIALPLELMGIDKHDIQSRIDPLLELTGLSGRADAWPSMLSGGQKQRVAIARALASRPRLLLCDEATSALDPQTTASILTLLRDINEQLGITILLITHEMEVVRNICDRVALLSEGRIIEHAATGEFFTRPESPEGRTFLNDYLELTPSRSLQSRLFAEPAEDRHPVVRLTFHDDSVARVLASRLAREFGVDISILQSRIEEVRGRTLGLMIAEIMGPASHTRQVLQHLHTLELDVEVLGHVQRHD